MHSIFIFVCICFLTCFSIEAKPPLLTPHDTHLKIEEILKAHVSHQKFNREVMIRSFSNFLEELDPMKTYFVETDLEPWLSPSEDLVNQALKDYNAEDFSIFEQMHLAMLKAIERRARLEAACESKVLPEKVRSSEFKEMQWAKNEEELEERICRIKALQKQTAAQIAEENQEQFLQRVEKRRLNREIELKASNPEEMKRLTLSYVLKAVSSSLDSQTLYFTPAEATSFMMQVQQKLFGIGAQLRDDLSGFTVVRLVEGSPASQPNKLKEGDRIVSVNAETVVGMDIVEAVEMIRGPQGSKVTLTVLREITEGTESHEEKLEVDLIRGEIVLKETRLETTYEPYGDGVIAIFHLFSFYQDLSSSSAQDLQDAITNLQNEKKIYGIVLDLRNNGGGVLQQAVAVTGLFIGPGVVVSVKDNTQEVQHLRNLENTCVWKGPLLVLTNRLSASAAEIVAQTLQDYGRALVVGDPETFGKGTFQTFTLEASHFGKVNPKGEFKVTRGRYYTVSGKSPQLIGVKADIIVPGIFLEMEIGEKYSKYPVSSDAIDAHFEDDLKDIPVMQRFQVSRLYKQKQRILSTYEPLKEQLKENSVTRISHNPNYQNFLLEVISKEEKEEPLPSCGRADLQLTETLNIMKDIVLFEGIKAKSAA